MKTTYHKSQILILLIFVLVTSILSCSKSDNISPIKNNSFVSNELDPTPDDVVVNDLNENYKFVSRSSSNHIRCKRGGHNCFQDGFIDPIGHGRPIIVQPDSSIIWLIYEIDSSHTFDTLIVDLE